MEHPTGLAVTEHVPDQAGTDGPVVVLVHGALDSSASFARTLRRLRDLPTVVYDRRGYRRSRHAVPPATTLDDHVDDLLGVIGARPAVVVGHSLGGDITLAAALRHHPPSTILSIAAYEPPLPWLPLASAGGITARKPTSDDPGQAAEQFFRRMVGDDAWGRLAPAAKDDRRADGDALLADLRAIRVARAPFDVTTMRVPALFARGELSIPRHRRGVAWLAAHTPGSELVDVAGASHGVHLTHPDAFADLVRRTMARATAPAADHG